MASKSDKVKEKEKVKEWIPVMGKLEDLEKGFVHLTAKTTHSDISGVGVRLKNDDGHPEIPYLSLTTLGASLDDLDYTDGGAAGIPLPRQVKDSITETSSGVTYEKKNLDDFQALMTSNFKESISAPRVNFQGCHPFLKQLYAEDETGERMLLALVGSFSLNKKILDRLESILVSRRESQTDAKVFWRTASVPNGGTKPQNLGMVPGLSKRAAHFALFIAPPSFPREGASRNLNKILTPPTPSVSRQDAKVLRKNILSVMENDISSNKETLEKQVLALFLEYKNKVVESISTIEGMLYEDILKVGGEPGRYGKNLLLKWIESKERIPGLNAAWTLNINLNQEMRGWLDNQERTFEWRKSVAERLIKEWVCQAVKSGRTPILVNERVVSVMERSIVKGI